MPQTSPLNWLMTSLIFLVVATFLSSNTLLKKNKVTSNYNSKTKKTLNWLW